MRTFQRFFLAIFFSISALLLGLPCVGPLYAEGLNAPQSPDTPSNSDTTGSSAQPNFLLILTDDQAYQYSAPLEAYMPATKRRIFDEGVSFEKSYVPTSNCCPSRSSTMTGMYASRHGVVLNQIRLRRQNIFSRMKAAGYYTGLVGKYLNSWRHSRKRPEFDQWYVAKRALQFLNPQFSINGGNQVVRGYQTEIIERFSLEVLDKALAQEKPFFLMVSPAAPHLPALPAPQDKGKFANFGVESLSFNLHCKLGECGEKPQWIRRLPSSPLSARRIASLNSLQQRHMECLLSVDRMIESLLDRLEASGQLDNTVVIFSSDNGYMFGDFGLDAKELPYEGAIKVPYAIRYSELIQPRVEPDALMANIDTMPTILELAGIDLPSGIDGKSLLPVLLEEGRGAEFREHLLLEGGWQFEKPRRGRQPGYNGIHTGRYVYIDSLGDSPELYDLETDPFQLNNLVNSPSHFRLGLELRAELAKLRAELPRRNPRIRRKLQSAAS